MPETRRSPRSQLKNAVRSALHAHKNAADGADKETPSYGYKSFPASRLFEEWFINRGQSYYFLFKKNLRVTNIQMAELVALLRVHAAAADNRTIDIQLLTWEEFRSAIERVGESFGPTGADKWLVDRYGRLLETAVILDPLFGSCIVYVPPTLTLPIEKVCAESGYIHSCGHRVYARNVYKATYDGQDGLRSRVRAYLRKNDLGKRNPVMFRVYAHEDFTDGDRHLKADLRNGLDDVKVFVEKFYIGSMPFLEAIHRLRDDFKKELVIPEGDYKEDQKIRDDAHAEKDRTLWLIMDHDIAGSGRHAGNRHFLICYDQLFINGNPFHVFDENKPAWVDHTTIPHTLMGAMINVTRPYWPRGVVKIADPFVGSGTAYLECTKFPKRLFLGSTTTVLHRYSVKKIWSSSLRPVET